MENQKITNAEGGLLGTSKGLKEKFLSIQRTIGNLPKVLAIGLSLNSLDTKPVLAVDIPERATPAEGYSLLEDAVFNEGFETLATLVTIIDESGKTVDTMWMSKEGTARSVNSNSVEWGRSVSTYINGLDRQLIQSGYVNIYFLHTHPVSASVEDFPNRGFERGLMPPSPYTDTSIAKYTRLLNSLDIDSNVDIRLSGGVIDTYGVWMHTLIQDNPIVQTETEWNSLVMRNPNLEQDVADVFNNMTLSEIRDTISIMNTEVNSRAELLRSIGTLDAISRSNNIEHVWKKFFDSMMQVFSDEDMSDDTRYKMVNSLAALVVSTIQGNMLSGNSLERLQLQGDVVKVSELRRALSGYVYENLVSSTTDTWGYLRLLTINMDSDGIKDLVYGNSENEPLQNIYNLYIELLDAQGIHMTYTIRDSE